MRIRNACLIAHLSVCKQRYQSAPAHQSISAGDVLYLNLRRLLSRHIQLWTLQISHSSPNISAVNKYYSSEYKKQRRMTCPSEVKCAKLSGNRRVYQHPEQLPIPSPSLNVSMTFIVSDSKRKTTLSPAPNQKKSRISRIWAHRKSDWVSILVAGLLMI
jgi:hypothetical protein